MTRFLLRSSLTLLVLFGCACTDDGPLPHGLDLDGGIEAGVSAAPILPADCAPLGDPLPKTLSCTGLYGAAGTVPVEKAVHTANREFTPGAQLWTDGADKLRWIALPEGTKIDTTNPNGWVFPNGTRVWKEFAFKGKRAETRFMYKKDDLWLFATYRWNDTDTEAMAVDGGDVQLVGGGVHSIPTLMQCNECHRGSRDKLLGFQHVLLGLPGAKGLTLPVLAAENRLSLPPARSSFTIPDDGTGMSAQALGWIHVNCGVSCHNETGNAQANMSRMFLRIDPATLEAASPADWNIVKLTVGVDSVTPNFRGTRIVAGAPDKSLIVQLAQSRGNNMAMPPLGTRIVDPTGIATVREWITRLGGKLPPDAGVAPDAGGGLDAAAPDAGVPPVDAAIADAELPDAELPDAGLPDAELPDAELPDAELPDAELPDAELPDTGVPAEGPPVVVTPPVEPPVVTPPVEPPVVTPPVETPVVVAPPVETPVVTPV